jgi:hypothetical protein
MVQPINYNVDIQDPSQAFLSAFKTGSAITKSRLEQEQAVRQAEQQKQIASAFTNLRKPGATAKDYADLAMLLPETQAKAIRESFNLLSTERQQSALQQSGQIFSAFKSGRPDIAISLIEKQIEAKRNAGDEEGAKFLETWKDASRVDPKATEDYFGFTISQMPGGKDVITSAIDLSKESREAALQPTALVEAKAKADKAVADAETAVSDAKIKAAKATTAIETETAALELAQAQARENKAKADKAELEAKIAKETELKTVERAVAEADKAVAEAKTAQANAKNAEERSTADLKFTQAQAAKEEALAAEAKVKADVAKETKQDIISGRKAETIIKEAEAKFAPQKFGADLGLTQAQIDASKAARRASDAAAAQSGAAAARARAEADQIAKGVIPADKRTEAEFKLRKEFTDQTKVFQDIKSSYGRVKVSEDTAVGDLSLIFGFMKMLDPGSVVREGEFATAQNATGVPERIANLYNRVISGERLSKSQRDSFKGQAEKLYKSALEQEKVVRDGIGRIAGGYGLNTKNIFYTDKEVPPSGPEPKPADKVTVGGKTYTRPATMTDAQWNAYKRSVGVQ